MIAKGLCPTNYRADAKSQYRHFLSNTHYDMHQKLTGDILTMHEATQTFQIILQRMSFWQRPENLGTLPQAALKCLISLYLLS